MTDGGFPVVGREPSSRGKGEYLIRRAPEGALLCQCDGFKWRGTCSHVKRFAERERKENMPVIKFKLTVKRGQEVLAEVEGIEKELDALSVGDVTERVIETEAYLERLLGLRVHIESDTK